MTGDRRAPLPLRRPDFVFPPGLDPCWATLPEVSYAANSVSLLMPYAEPYFVRSMRAALVDLEATGRLDDHLRVRTEQYIAQELAHQSEHRSFNAVLRSRYTRLQRLERVMGRTCLWLGRRGGMRNNVAFASASETIAFGLARWTEKHLDLLGDLDSPAARMFLWHLAEEVEHKSAAHAVHRALGGSGLRHLAAGVFAASLLGLFVVAGVLTMLAADRRLWSPVAHWRLARLGIGAAFTVLPLLAAASLRGHEPDELADPSYLPTWLATLGPRAADPGAR